MMHTGETSGANSYELQLLQSNEQEVMAALVDLRKDARWNNNEELSEIVDIYCENIGRITREFCAAIRHHLKAINRQYQSLVHAAFYGEASVQAGHVSWRDDPLIAVDELLYDLEGVYRQELLMKERLQSFDDSLVENVDCIDVGKKVCAIFFTAAAAVSAAAAAAKANSNTAAAAAASAASILFGAVGKWTHSVLKKRESAVKKHKEIVGVMISWTDISIEDLTNIRDLADRLQVEAKSMTSELADDDVDCVWWKMAAVKESFRTLRGKAKEYSRKMKWAAQAVRRSLLAESD